MLANPAWWNVQLSGKTIGIEDFETFDDRITLGAFWADF